MWCGASAGKESVMKNIVCILVISCLALTVAVDNAQAGLLSLFKKGNEQKDSEVQAPRYDKYPTMGFYMGTLTRSGWTDWQLGDEEVEIDKGCTTTKGGTLADLRAGSQAIVMGTRVGDKILAYRIRVLEPQWAVEVADNHEDIQWSTTDPTVGEGTGPN